MKNSTTPIILCLSLIVFLAMLGGTLFFIQKIAEKNTHTAVVIETLESKIKEKENYELLKKKVAEAKDVHGRINAYLVDADTIDSFITSIESLGSDTGTIVTVSNVTPLPDTTNALSVNMSGRGSFKDVMKLLSLLESMPYSLKIKSAFLNQDIVSPNNIKQSNILWQIDVAFTVIHY